MNKKSKVFNKYYRDLRTNVFSDLDLPEFAEVFQKFSKLSMQYHFLQIANFLEKLYIPKFNFPIIKFLFMLLDLIRWKVQDFFIRLINGRTFNLYGVTCYCGRQGSGKTIGVVEKLERIKQAYPECIICTNINYLKQDLPLTSWLQLLYLRNGDKGVVFVIDEVQNQGLDWSKFPDVLLQVITMQRKQKIKIFLTSQVYKNVVIQLRRQCFDVVECKTFLGRWSRQKCYDAEDYNNILDLATPEKRRQLMKKWKFSFVQDNHIRTLYDTNQIVDTLDDFDKLSSPEVRQEIRKMRNKPNRILFSVGYYQKGVLKFHNVYNKIIE